MRSRSFEDVERALGSGHPPRSILIAGTEHYQRNRLVSAVLERFSGPGAGEEGCSLEVRRLDAPSLAPGELGRLVSEGSLFSEGTVLVVSDVGGTPRGCRDELLGVASSPGGNALLMTTDETSLGGSLLRKLADAATTYVCYPPFERDMARWAGRIAREQGVELTRGAIDHLVSRFPDSLSSLADATGRLALFYGPGSRIDERDVSRLIDSRESASVFDLMDVLFRGDRAGATKAFWSILESGEEIVGVLSFLHSQWQKLQLVREGLSSGQGAQRVASELGLRGRMLERLVSAASSECLADPAEAAEAFASADEAAKTGADPFMLSAMLILVLTRGRR
ncbi:hypothetical protein JW921_11150 [Candidatus Fermentibacterales bacterium]|nr:hypothetical protein [Candidatus Fermentibacterales bacterium]